MCSTIRGAKRFQIRLEYVPLVVATGKGHRSRQREVDSPSGRMDPQHIPYLQLDRVTYTSDGHPLCRLLLLIGTLRSRIPRRSSTRLAEKCPVQGIGQIPRTLWEEISQCSRAFAMLVARSRIKQLSKNIRAVPEGQVSVGKVIG